MGHEGHEDIHTAVILLPLLYFTFHLYCTFKVLARPCMQDILRCKANTLDKWCRLKTSQHCVEYAYVTLKMAI
jgi:hypothetical protein